MKTVHFNFLGQSQLTTFGEGVTINRKGKDYVKVDFKGKGGLGKSRIKRPDTKKEVATGAILGGGTGLLTQTVRKKGGWKSKLAASTIGAGFGAGTAYLSSKRGIFAKDVDGRSDKGKKRK